MPEIFGVSWGMYAILGALVVILVLLLIVSRRRRSAGSPTAAKSKKRGKPSQDKHGAKVDKKARYAELRQQAEASGLQSSGVGGAIPPVAPSAAPAAPQPPVGYDLNQLEPSGPATPAPLVHSVPVEQFMPESDPLNALLIDVLSGWGEITQDDTNRLGVFRPERVAAAMASMELPRDLRGSDQARARLSQLRRWASGLEQTARATAQEKPPAQQEYSGINAGVSAGAAEPPVSAPAPVTGPDIAATPAPAAAPTPAATPTPTEMPSPASPPPAPVTPAVAAAAVAPAAAFAPAAPAAPITPAAPTEAAAPQPPPESKWEPDWDSPNHEPAPFAPRSTRSASPEVVSAPPATAAPNTAPASAPVPGPLDGTPAAPHAAVPADDRNAAMAEAAKSTEAAVAAAAAAFWARPEMNGALSETQPSGDVLPGSPPQDPQSAASLSQPARPVGSSGPDTFMADLRSGPNTAGAVLAMPAAEQASALAFLKPVELAKVLKSAGDVELKKSAIDQLRSIGSPEALDIIYKSLDDADPQLQAKALEAADKLLGAQ